jgi:calcium/calmodulin-dependent protein kinase I
VTLLGDALVGSVATIHLRAVSGVISFIMLCGYPPFYDESDAVLFEMIMKGRFSFDERYWKDVTAEAKDLIRNMLQVG